MSTRLHGSDCRRVTCVPYLERPEFYRYPSEVTPKRPVRPLLVRKVPKIARIQEAGILDVRRQASHVVKGKVAGESE